MKQNIVWMAFAALVVAQWAVPGSIIVQHESAIANGAEFKIHTRPVDPYDAFRGRYVQLGFDVVSVPKPEGMRLERRREGYVSLETGDDGFVKVAKVSLERPNEGVYLRADLHPHGPDAIRVAWPFDRYYMEESAAPAAERVYRERSGEHAAYIKVKVNNGVGVVTGLFVDDASIEEYLERK